MGFDWDRTPTLVIGGAGNLGRALVQMLLERGAKVSSFDLEPHPSAAVSSTVGSVSDCAALDRALRGVAVVFHTASVINIQPVPSPAMRAINVDGTYNVITCCKRAGVQRLVYTSSLEVVSGSDENGTPLRANGVDESAPIPVTHFLPYAASKAAAERLVLVANSPQLLTCAVRPGYIMGARCIGLRLEMMRARARRDHFVTSRGPAVISTVHPRNCALVHILAAEQAHEAAVGGRAFFSRDFEANVVAMYLECFRQPELGLKAAARSAYAWHCPGFTECSLQIVLILSSGSSKQFTKMHQGTMLV